MVLGKFARLVGRGDSRVGGVGLAKISDFGQNPQGFDKNLKNIWSKFQRVWSNSQNFRSKSQRL